MSAPRIVVMGVSGCGKSTIGACLAARLGLKFVEGDELHLVESIERMRNGLPLDDDMRWPWLDRISNSLQKHADGVVVSCSALKRTYRQRLSMANAVFFLHIDVERKNLLRRMSSRQHFMPTSLLDSQLATLEPLAPDEFGATLDGRLNLPRLLAAAESVLGPAISNI
ncbi:gluconokinase [Sinorhizobium alkalisoli]|uniref:gluconokinase n=1 Tax=Sinorhizobium alkalisoli TaxID=1752398 RepID=UPI00124C2069|nr:gluconokinase, GntK/IdnK-type [Sinorhizobium alkalisoli]QFI68803.1 Gluconokinase [Sinorhizobium alkalisoli]